MWKESIANVIITSLTVLLLICCLFYSYNTKQQVEHLQVNYTMMEKRLMDKIAELQQKTEESDKIFAKELKKAQSIFSHTQVDVKPQGDKIIMTMRAVPKDIASGEVLVARLTADGKQYEQVVDENNQAVIIADMAKKIIPEFVINSEIRTRREVLEEIDGADVFKCNLESQWDEQETLDDKLNLKIWLNDNNVMMPFKESEIAAAEFIIVNNGIIEATNSGEEIPTDAEIIAIENEEAELEQPEGAKVTATKIAEKDSSQIGYIGDFSEYAEKNDGINYLVYFTLTTTDGVKYITPTNNQVGAFSFSDEGTKSESGMSKLVAVFK